MNAFDERMRARAKTEDCPLPEGFGARLAGLVEELPEELPEQRRRVRPRVWRGALIAAAVCVALTASALALSPTLREALAATLGSFEPYAQEVEGVSAIDQGIRISVVRAIADGDQGRVYLEVTDLAGDRLDAHTDLDGIDYSEDTAEAYDAEHHTALYMRRISDSQRNEDGTVTVKIKEIFPGIVRLGRVNEAEKRVEGTIPLPQSLLGTDTLETHVLTAEDLEGCYSEERAQRMAGELVLAPNQTPAALDTQLFSLSSAGYDREGYYHVQFEIADGVYLRDGDGFLIPDFPAFWEEGENWTSTSMHTVSFGGGKYYDVRLDNVDDLRPTPEDIRALGPGTVNGSVMLKEPIRGEWELTFPLEIVPERTVATSDIIASMQMDRITLTAMGLKIEAHQTNPDSRHSGTLGNFPIAVFLADGSVVHSDRFGRIEFKHDADRNYTGEFWNVWELESAIDPAQVVGVSLGYWYVPIDGDTGGPGRWLEALPE